MKTLLILIMLPSLAFGGIFSRLRSNRNQCVQRVVVANDHHRQQIVVVQQPRPLVLQQDYAYQTPLLGVSPAVIEQHSYDLARSANLSYTRTATLSLSSSDSLVQLQKMQAVLAAGQSGTLVQQSIVQQPLPLAVSIIETKCAKCHGAKLASPKNELFITKDMDAETRLKALKAVRDDKMPKNHPLTDEEKALFMEEILNYGEKK